MEAQRQLFEESEALETAILLRFRRNGDLASKCGVKSTVGGDSTLNTKGTKRPHKESLLLQHEMAYFAEQYERNCKRIKDNFASSILSSDITLLKDPYTNLEGFSSRLREIQDKHRGQNVMARSAEPAMAPLTLFSSAPADEIRVSASGHPRTKRKYILSRAGHHIKSHIDRVFRDSEMLGRRLDLSPLYDEYKRGSGVNGTYIEYLRLFDEFLAEKRGNFSARDYHRYLSELVEYLETFRRNALPLEYGDSQVFKNEEMKDGVPDAVGQVYCLACDKVFPKETVYRGHLQGKKHKKAASNSQQDRTEVPGAPGAPGNSGTISSAALEKQIQTLAKQVRLARSEAIYEQERQTVASERERIIESAALAGEESELTGVESGADNESDNSDDDDNLDGGHLPLGTDGTPIPLWLYKLQGLHQRYTCEVCGNHEYRGRQQFDKHFTSARHTRGLGYLGVSDEEMAKFVGVATIAEATDLWKRLRREKRAASDDVENAVEIEDDSGDVMTMKDYVDLKRQGLL